MKKSTLSLFWLVIALAILGLGACRTIRPENKYNGEPPDSHTTRIALSWTGEYIGIIPSANGRMMKVYLNLFCNDAFELTYWYLDKPDDPFLAMGKFKWDKSESYITLNVKNFPPYYMVVERRLILSDRKGRFITDGQEEYCLMKRLHQDL